MSIGALRTALAPVEAEARRLPWAEDRPWRTETHVWDEEGPVVDLHDLDVPLALTAVRLAADAPDPALVFVVGRGQHRNGVKGAPRDDSPLAVAVRDALGRRAREEGSQLLTPRAGRVALVRDARRAAPTVTGRLSPWFWVGAFAFGAVATVVVPPFGLLVLSVLVMMLRAERRRR